MRIKVFQICLVIIFLCLLGTGMAEPVASIDSTEYDTLQEAVNAATTGDVIILKSNLTIEGLDVVSKNITIHGGSIPFKLTFTNDKDLSIRGGAELVLESIQLAADTGSSSKVEAKEAALISFANAEVELPVSVNDADLYMVDSQMKSGINATATAANQSDIRIEDTQFLAGSSIESNSADVEIDDSEFNGNAGAVKAAGGTVTIFNCTFEGNMDTPVSVNANAVLEITGSQFRNNKGTNGGAIALNASSATINDSVITSNEATGTGGGIYATGSGSLSFQGNQLYGNKAGTAAADVYVSSDVNTVSLASVSGMDIPEGRFKLDGWYEDAAVSRWTKANAYAGTGNAYVGDTITTPDHSLKAGFTAYDDVIFTKSWIDDNNYHGTRIVQVKMTLKDGGGSNVKLRNADGSDGDSATVVLSEGTSWSGTVSPLQVADYMTGYTIEELNAADNSAINTYQMGTPVWTFAADTWTDENGVDHSGPSGIYTAAMTYTYKIPVTVAKVWDDADNKDGVRPARLNTQLTLNGTVATTYSDLALTTPSDVITLDPSNNWSKTVYVLARADNPLLGANEGQADGYTMAEKGIKRNGDGSISVSFVNHHDLNTEAGDTVSNANMVYIHYRVDKEWDGTAAGILPHPEITVILKDDNGVNETGVIPADAGRARYTFFNKEKFKDNEGNDLVPYSIVEDITDEGWVKAGGEWYSLDGMGKYSAAYTQAVIDSDTELLSTVQGKIKKTYQLLQDTTQISIEKIWKDHDNGNEDRPSEITVGLFTPDGTTLIKAVPIKEALAWKGTIDDLPLYDADGTQIDYTAYILKESYDYDEANPGSAHWISEGGDWTLTDTNGNNHKYVLTKVENRDN